MKRGMTIEYLMCRADLNFEVDFGVNRAIGTIVTKWDSDNASFSSIIIFFKYPAFPPLIVCSIGPYCYGRIKIVYYFYYYNRFSDEQ